MKPGGKRRRETQGRKVAKAQRSVGKHQFRMVYSEGSARVRNILALGILFAGSTWGPCAADCSAAEPALSEVISPVPYQVVQREGHDPRRAGPHEPGGAQLGYADVPVEVNWPAGALKDSPKIEARVEPLAGAFGSGTDWAALAGELREGEQKWLAKLRIPAGGWYRLSVRVRRGDETLATASVEPFGVGEVFVVAGQSYAVGANDELMKVDDPAGRVVAYDMLKRTWQVANDPQPNAGDGGTIWPTTGNFLLPIAQVPIGFVNVAVGGTASRQWLPGERLYENLAAAGKAIGRFRAVLWQQGESDVIEHRSTAYYISNLTKIRASLAAEWGFEPPWLLAKSTLHPTVYNDPEGEARIRTAIDELCQQPGFRPGPDTDLLTGENRGGLGTRRHFSGIGQRRAGQMWFAAIWGELARSQ